MSNSKRRCLAPIGSAVRGTRTRSPRRREWRRLAGTPQRWRADSCSGEARRPRRTGSSGSRGELDLDGTATGGGAEDEEEVVVSLLPAAPRSGPRLSVSGDFLSFFLFCFVVVSVCFIIFGGGTGDSTLTLEGSDCFV
jgi:hypothetical protein